MGKKPVSKVPGIGPEGERKLKQEGFEYASQIFGQFLVLNEDEEKFEDWLKQRGIGEAYCKRVYLALQEWSGQYFK